MKSESSFRLSLYVAAISAVFGASTAAVAAAGPAGQRVQGPYPVASYSSIDLTTPPVVAANASGQFVVGWQPNVFANGQFGPALVQAFSGPVTAGSPAIPVGTQVFGGVAVAVDKEGDFVVAWRDGTVVQKPDWGWVDLPYPASTGTLYIQRYSASGVAQGAPLAIAQSYDGLTKGHGQPPSLNWYGDADISAPVQVAMDDDGDVVVGWSELAEYDSYDQYSGAYGSSSSATYMEVFAANGKVLQPLTTVDAVKSSGRVRNVYAFEPVDGDVLAGIASNGKGQFELLFNRYRKAEAQSPLAKVFQLGPNPTGTAFTLDADAGNTITSGLFGLDAAGNLAVGWTSKSGVSIVKYSSDGTQQGAVIGPVGNGSHPCASTLSVMPSGNLAVTWGVLKKVDLFGTGTPEDSCAKQAQFLNADGSASSAPVLVDAGNKELDGPDMAAAVDGAGTIISIWSTTQADHSSALMGAVVKSGLGH